MGWRKKCHKYDTISVNEGQYSIDQESYIGLFEPEPYVLGDVCRMLNTDGPQLLKIGTGTIIPLNES